MQIISASLSEDKARTLGAGGFRLASLNSSMNLSAFAQPRMKPARFNMPMRNSGLNPLRISPACFCTSRKSHAARMPKVVPRC